MDNKINGVTLGWDGKPTICFEVDGKEGLVLPRAAEEIIHKKYYENDHANDWPCDPVTGEQLPIWEPPSIHRAIYKRLRWWLKKINFRP